MEQKHETKKKKKMKKKVHHEEVHRVKTLRDIAKEEHEKAKNEGSPSVGAAEARDDGELDGVVIVQPFDGIAKVSSTSTTASGSGESQQQVKKVLPKVAQPNAMGKRAS